MRPIHDPEVPIEEVPFPFKFKAPSGRVHRLQVIAANGIAELIAQVNAKLGAEAEAVGGAASFEDGKLGASGYALSYLDDEGDTVSITTDHDLKEAILIARQGRREKVDLFVHDPSQPAITAVAEVPTPVIETPAPPPATLRRRHIASDDEDSEEEREHSSSRRSRRNKQEVPQPPPQIIAGVPNELLLPGAIVTLAVAIVGVFAITRASSR
jgi:hypothetical protein